MMYLTRLSHFSSNFELSWPVFQGLRQQKKNIISTYYLYIYKHDFLFLCQSSSWKN